MQPWRRRREERERAHRARQTAAQLALQAYWGPAGYDEVKLVELLRALDLAQLVEVEGWVPAGGPGTTGLKCTWAREIVRGVLEEKRNG